VRYIPSTHNPTDEAYQGIYGRRDLLLPTPNLGKLANFIMDFDNPDTDAYCLLVTAARGKPRGVREYRRSVGDAEYNIFNKIKLARSQQYEYGDDPQMAV
jgi:hypothetical protein